MRKTLIASWLALTGFCSWTQAQAQQVVTIGHSAPLTGPQAVNAKDNENGVRMAIEDLNRKGLTIGGQKVAFKLDSEDDQADPRIGVQIAQKLADGGVVAVLGPYNSGVAIPASKVFSAAGIPMLSVASNPSLTQQGFNNIFRIGASDVQLGGTMADFAVRALKAKTAVLIDDRTAYGQGLADEFSRVAKARGIRIIDHQYTNSNATDFLGILTAIKAENPDVIFFGGYAAQGGPMAKQMRQRGVRAKLLGGDSICLADMGRLAGDAASIVYCAQGGISLDKTPAGRNFVKRYKDTYHTDTQVYAVNYYDGMMLLADAMAKADTTSDRAKLITQLHKTNYQGVAGTYSFDAKGDLKGAPTTVYVIKNGLPVPYGQGPFPSEMQQSDATAEAG